MQRDLGPLRDTQPEFDPYFAAIECILRGSGRNPEAIAREKTAVAIIPAAKLGVARADITDVGLREIDFDVEVVRLEQSVAVDRPACPYPSLFW